MARSESTLPASIRPPLRIRCTDPRDSPGFCSECDRDPPEGSAFISACPSEERSVSSTCPTSTCRRVTPASPPTKSSRHMPTSNTSAGRRSPKERYLRFIGSRRFHNVAHPAHGVDHRRTTGINLFPKVRNVQLYHVSFSAEIKVPHGVQDLCLRNYL